MKRILLMVLSLVLILSTFPSYSSASNKNFDSKEGLIEVNITKESFDIAMEIAGSNLENSVVIDSDGKLNTPFSDYQSAKVTKKAYDKFKEILDSFNDALAKGELIIVDASLGLEGIGLSNGVITGSENFEDNGVSPMFKVIGTNYFKLSNSDVGKVNKVINFGGSAASLAALLGISLGVGAIVFAAAHVLGAGLNLCNWNDKGVYIRKVAYNWTCMPVF